MASTASDTSNTSSKQQQAQRKKKIIYNSKNRKEEDFTQPTHVTVYLFRDLNQNRSRLQGGHWVPGSVQTAKKKRKGKMTLTVEHFSLTAKTANTSK